MFKKVTLLALNFLFLSLNQGFANFEIFEEKPDGTVRAVFRLPNGGRVEMESVTSLKQYEAAVAAAEERPGYPLVRGADARFKGQNMDRQVAHNPYHQYKIFFLPPVAREDTERSSAPSAAVALTVAVGFDTIAVRSASGAATPAAVLGAGAESSGVTTVPAAGEPTTVILSERIDLGLVQFGRMLTKGYAEGIDTPEKDKLTVHHEIIKTVMALGITAQIDPAVGLGDANIVRIANRGAAFILPFFNPQIALEQRSVVLRTCHAFVTECTKRGFLLPGEQTRPHVLMALHHPEDPNVEAFMRAGFKADTNSGFGWFYPKGGRPDPRVMLTCGIDGRPMTQGSNQADADAFQ